MDQWRQQHRPVWRVAGRLAAAWCVLVCMGAAAQAEPWLADLVEPKQVRSVVSRETARLYAEAIGLAEGPGDERAAAEGLVNGAREEIGAAVNRHIRRMRTMSDRAQEAASLERMMAEARRIEIELITGLREVASESRTEGFTTFLQRRRIDVLIKSPFVPIPATLRSLLAEAEVNRAEVEGLSAVLASHERELDQALRDFVQSLRELSRVNALPFDGDGPVAQALAAAREAERQARLQLRRVQVQGWRSTLALLDEEARDRMVLERVRAELAGLDRQFEAPVFGDDRASPVVREVLRVPGLSDAQKAEIELLRERFRAEYVRVAARYIQEDDDEEIRLPEDRARRQPSARNAFVEARRQLRERLDAEVMALLSPEQRDAYDRVPVEDLLRWNDIPEEE